MTQSRMSEPTSEVGEATRALIEVAVAEGYDRATVSAPGWYVCT